MAYNNPVPGSLKRKRRRRPDRPPLSAKLQLDDRLKGDVALISADLLDELHPSSKKPAEPLLHFLINWQLRQMWMICSTLLLASGSPQREGT